MPPYRRKMRCAGYDAEPKPKAAPKPKTPRAAPRTKLTDEEKAQKREEAAKKKALTEKKKEWKATLKPWTVDTTFKLGVGRMAMYKSDAKHASYGLTEEEILTLPHESIACSPKTFYACQTAADLSLKKEKFFDPDFIIPPPDETQQVWRGLLKKPRAVFKKTDDDPRRRRKNFDARDVTTQVFSETKDPKTLVLIDFM